MAKNNFKKAELKLISNIYIATILIQTDAGWIPEEMGLTEDDADYIIAFINKQGHKMSESKKFPNFTSLPDIVKYVDELFYNYE